MKKYTYLFLCFIFISCFTEPKKGNVVSIEENKKPTSYIKENISLEVLNKAILFDESEFASWCLAQNFKHYSSDDNHFYEDDKKSSRFIWYSSLNDEEGIILKIPNTPATKRNISYIISDKQKYYKILNEIENSNFKVDVRTEKEIKFYNYNSELNIFINDANGVMTYSIELQRL